MHILKRTMEFRQKLNQYLQIMENDRSLTAYLELSKKKEIDYFKRFRYRFKSILLDMEDCTDPTVILDIGTSPFTFFLKTHLVGCDINTILQVPRHR